VNDRGQIICPTNANPLQPRRNRPPSGRQE
jgi:hypothetical protein